MEEAEEEGESEGGWRRLRRLQLVPEAVWYSKEEEEEVIAAAVAVFAGQQPFHSVLISFANLIQYPSMY